VIGKIISDRKLLSIQKIFQNSTNMSMKKFSTCSAYETEVESGCIISVFAGPEPLFHPDFPDLIF
jgi:hypothetical protein